MKLLISLTFYFFCTGMIYSQNVNWHTTDLSGLFCLTENGNSIVLSNNSVNKIDPIGNTLYTLNFTGASTQIHGIKGNSLGQFVIYGKFGVEDFDLGPGTNQLVAGNGTQDWFYAKYDASGNLIGVITITPNSGTYMNIEDLDFSDAGVISIIGNFNGIITYKFGTTTINTSSSDDSDIFIINDGPPSNFVFGAVNIPGDQYAKSICSQNSTGTLAIAFNTHFNGQISPLNSEIDFFGTNYSIQYGSTQCMVLTLDPSGGVIDGLEFEDGTEHISELNDISFGNEDGLLYFIGSSESGGNLSQTGIVGLTDGSGNFVVNNQGFSDLAWGVISIPTLAGQWPNAVTNGIYFMSTIGNEDYNSYTPKYSEININNGDIYISNTTTSQIDYDPGVDSVFQTIYGNGESTIRRISYNPVTNTESLTSIFTIGGSDADEIVHFDFDNNNDLFVGIGGNQNGSAIDIDPSPVTILSQNNTVIKYEGNSSVISGIVFNDINGNGNFDTEEERVPNAIINIDNGTYSFSVTSNQDGIYKANVTTGDYTVTCDYANSGYYSGVIPTIMNVNIYTTNTLYTTNNFALTETPNVTDILINLIPITPVRPGFEAKYKIYIKNNGTTNSNANFSLDFHNTFTLNSTNLTPSSQANNNIYWTIDNLIPGQDTCINVNFQIPTDIGLGTLVTNIISAGTNETDTNEDDNYFTLNQISQGSYDPNDKVVSPLYLTQEFVNDNEYLNYSIRFQNTGTDTAFTVIVRDTLDNFVNPNTIQFLSSSHSMTPTLYYDVTNSKQIMEFKFLNILLPDSNVNEPKSHGFLSYRIKLIDGFSVGDAAYNTADIYFDYNEPIITNTTESKISQITLNETLTNLNCFNECDGEIQLNTSGGIGPYNYSWSSQTDGTNLCPGEYSVLVKDQVGNMKIAQYTIENAISILNSVTSTNASNTGVDNGSIDITTTGGAGNFQYSIDGGQTYTSNSSFTDLETGSYDICSKDQNNCVACDTTIVISEGIAGAMENADQVISIYPNPTSGDFNINFEGNNINRIDIINVIGEVVFSENIDENINQLRIQTLSKGVYMIKLQTQSNNIITRKLIVK